MADRKRPISAGFACAFRLRREFAYLLSPFLDRSIKNIEIFISIGIELPSYNLSEYFSMERIPLVQDSQIAYVMPDFLPGRCHRRSAAALFAGDDLLLPRNHCVTWFVACIVCFITGTQVD